MDETITVLPADKGRVTVVMKKEEYREKCRLLLEDSKTYLKLKSDPTAKYKKQFILALKDLKDRQVIPPNLHKRLYLPLTTPMLLWVTQGAQAKFATPTHCELNRYHLLLVRQVPSGYSVPIGWQDPPPHEEQQGICGESDKAEGRS